MTFENVSEFSEMAMTLMNNEKLMKNVAAAGRKRFIEEHDSKKRLQKILTEITAL